MWIRNVGWCQGQWGACKVKVLLLSALRSQQKVMGIGVGTIALDFHKNNRKCPIYNAKSKIFGGGRGKGGD